MAQKHPAGRCGCGALSRGRQVGVGSSSSLLLSSLELSDTKVYGPEMRTLLGTASHFCEVRESRTVLNCTGRCGCGALSRGRR